MQNGYIKYRIRNGRSINEKLYLLEAADSVEYHTVVESDDIKEICKALIALEIK